jgi:hypothetical protein
MPLLTASDIRSAFEVMHEAQRVEMEARFRLTADPTSDVIAQEVARAAETAKALTLRFTILFADYRRQHGD